MATASIGFSLVGLLRSSSAFAVLTQVDVACDPDQEVCEASCCLGNDLLPVVVIENQQDAGRMTSDLERDVEEA